MAESLRRLTRNQMGSSCANSKLADCDIFRSPLFNTTSNLQEVRNKKNIQYLEKEEESHKTIQDRMTDTDKTRDSEMQSRRSADGVWIEIR